MTDGRKKKEMTEGIHEIIRDQKSKSSIGHLRTKISTKFKSPWLLKLVHPHLSVNVNLSRSSLVAAVRLQVLSCRQT